MLRPFSLQKLEAGLWLWMLVMMLEACGWMLDRHTASDLGYALLDRRPTDEYLIGMLREPSLPLQYLLDKYENL